MAARAMIVQVRSWMGTIDVDNARIEWFAGPSDYAYGYPNYEPFSNGPHIGSFLEGFVGDDFWDWVPEQ